MLMKVLRVLIPIALALIAVAIAVLTGHAEDFPLWVIVALGLLAGLGSLLQMWREETSRAKGSIKPAEPQPGFADAPSSFMHQSPTTKTKQKSEVDGQQNVAPQVIGDHANVTIHQHASAPDHPPTKDDQTQAGAPACLHALPAKNSDFVGREEGMARIRAALIEEGTAIPAIDGLSGLGKTTMAIEVAYKLVDEGAFPDGVAFINLEGFSEDREPLSTEQALGKLIEQLDNRNTKLPKGLDALQQLWRQLTADRVMLLLLDNAQDENQIAPLLPVHATCRVLVTSRNRLAHPGFKPIELGLLTEEQAADLAVTLANRRQEDRLTREQAAKLSTLCGRHTQSIEVTANALGQSLGRDIGIFFKELEQATKPLPELDRPKAAVRTSVALADAQTQEAWRILSVFSGDFDCDAAGHVVEVAGIDKVLADLEQRSLITFSDGRYALHDIVHATALGSLSNDEREAAEVRHAKHYYNIMAAADADSEGEAFPLGYKMYERELHNISAAEQWISENYTINDTARELASGLSNLELSGYFVRSPLRKIERTIISLKAGNKVGLAVAAFEYATRLSLPRCNYESESIRWFQRSRILFRQLDMREGLAEANSRFAAFIKSDAQELGGQIPNALEYAEQLLNEAIDLYRGLGWNRCQGEQLHFLGHVKFNLGKSNEGRQLVQKGNALQDAFHEQNKRAMASGQYDLMPKEESEKTRLIDHWKHQLHDIRSMNPETWKNEICTLPYWPQVDHLLVAESIIEHQ